MCIDEWNQISSVGFDTWYENISKFRHTYAHHSNGPGEPGLAGSAWLPLPRRLFFHRLSVCLLATLCKNFRMDLREIFTKGWQWANQQMTKFLWRFRSVSGYRDCFPDSLLSGDTESGINCLRYATMQSRAGTAIATTTSLHHRPATEPQQTCLGGGMHCPRAFSFLSFFICSQLVHPVRKDQTFSYPL